MVGGTVTLTNLIALLQANVDKSSHFVHLANHLLKVIYFCTEFIESHMMLLLQIANVPVRNVSQNCTTYKIHNDDYLLTLL